MRRHQPQKSLGRLMSIVALFLFGGVVMLLQTWLPVQAQRKLDELKKWEKKLSQDKRDLRNLKEDYLNRTALSVLDKWAKSNGNWRNPSGNNVIIIHE